MAIKGTDIIKISLDNLKYDSLNPRIPRSIDTQREDIVLEWMLGRENVIDLMNSIGEKGFFPGEPLLVIHDNEEVDKYIVVEGNRRFTASLLLSHPQKAPIKKNSVIEIASNAKFHPTELPVICFPSREDILDYLGYRHITGVEAWDALAKARYLSQLWERLDQDLSTAQKYKVLAKQIGSNAPYVRQLLLGKMLYDIIETSNFYSISNLNDQTFEFGTFYTAIAKPNIAKYIGINNEIENPLQDIDETHLSELTRWIFEKNAENQTRLGESRNLGKLDKILDPRYPVALEAFRNGDSLSIASELTNEIDELVAKKLLEAYRAMELVWNSIPKINDYSTIDKDLLKNINRYVQGVYQAAKEALEKKDIETLD